MEFVTIDFILQHFNVIAEEEDIEFSITSDAFVFILILLTPYGTALDTINDINVISPWIDQTFEPNIVNEIHGNFGGPHIINVVRNNRLNIVENYPNDLTTGKQAVVRGILDKLMKELTYVTDGDLIGITSFDVLEAIREDDLRPIAELSGFVDDTHLPVRLNINGNVFTHDMTFELVLGIIIFYKHLGLNHPLTLFGNVLDYDNKIRKRIVVVDEPLDYLTAALPYKYVVGLQGRYIQYYSFDSSDFIQGLTTAAEWNHVNVHDYVDNLAEQHYPMNRRLQF